MRPCNPLGLGLPLTPVPPSIPPLLQDATETDDIFLSIVAASAAYLAIMVGKRLSLDLSSKLFTIAFILVCFSSQEGRGEGSLRACMAGALGISAEWQQGMRAATADMHAAAAPQCLACKSFTLAWPGLLQVLHLFILLHG